jgi:hypothetical protein
MMRRDNLERMELMRLVLLILMVATLFNLWRNPRMILWFAGYILLCSVKIVLFWAVPWKVWYVPLDAVILLFLIMASREAFNHLAMTLPHNRERSALVSSMFGYGLALGSLFLSVADKDLIGWFNAIRASIHAGLFGFMLIGLLYVGLGRPFSVEVIAFLHAITLTVWLGAHTISRYMGRHDPVYAAHLFLPVAIVCFAGWNGLLIFYEAKILRPRFFFGTPPRPEVSCDERVNGNLP